MLNNQLENLIILTRVLSKYIKFIKLELKNSRLNNNPKTAVQLQISIQSQYIQQVMTILFHIFGYKQLLDIAGIDNISEKNRFEVNYLVLNITPSLILNTRSIYIGLQLMSLPRILVKTTLGSSPTVQTVTKQFLSANWLERECFDMYGIIFKDHGDLRRILTDYGFTGFPLRKDYPLSGYHQIRIRTK